MPILQACAHRIDKHGDDSPATLTAGEALAASEAAESLLAAFNQSFHAKPKAWGHFVEQPGEEADTQAATDAGDESEVVPFAADTQVAAPAPSRFAASLTRYRRGELNFTDFTIQAAQDLLVLVDAQLSVGGQLWCVHNRQGETEFLTLALLHQRRGYGFDAAGQVVEVDQLNLGQLMLAARIDLTQWQRGESRQYIAHVQDRGSKKTGEAFREWLGCREGVDASAETRTLLKAFSDYVEHEDLNEEASREKTSTLIDYANAQAKRGEPITLDELSELVDETQPKAFYDYIRNQDYGLAAEIPPDKRTLQQFKRFTGRATGVSISFDSHLLGNSIEYDEERERLIIKQIPGQLKDQIKQRGQ
ncbi:nucleoid-associated protein YejK [Salinicola endophyticus]|uniref:Nucleoid-associated protein YejK n=1 Tax=Salinicola endophyticus TaxID=1949083 RepID=A0ABY8FH21_9GAMM|nr:nucleoid-associated protein [Salinicola endophyticus]WFF42106.1 nucleoid-associated protein YejK [Salinicola endophyticus]